MPAGASRIVLAVAAGREAPRIQLFFRRRSTVADRERLAEIALAGAGSAERGRAVFLDAERSRCVQCHRMDREGGRIGPDLSGAGSRFSRAHLIESILEPSCAIAPGYGSVAVVLRDGQVLSGVQLAGTATTLTLGDSQGESHELPRSEIETVEAQPHSLMPEGLEKLLSEAEFLDLVAFLHAATAADRPGGS